MTILSFRKATKEDLPEIVRLLAEDPHSNNREEYKHPLPSCYHEAFEAIDRDHNQLLMVAQKETQIVGTLQLTFIPNISFKGAMRALIEAVMVDRLYHGQGIGSAMMQWAIERAKDRKCTFVQLTSNAIREDAHRFYARLGFTPSHTGFKLMLD